jgi:hypothetical protein
LSATRPDAASRDALAVLVDVDLELQPAAVASRSSTRRTARGVVVVSFGDDGGDSWVGVLGVPLRKTSRKAAAGRGGLVGEVSWSVGRPARVGLVAGLSMSPWLGDGAVDQPLGRSS